MAGGKVGIPTEMSWTAKPGPVKVGSIGEKWNTSGLLERFSSKPKFKVQMLHKKPVKRLKSQSSTAWQCQSTAVCRVMILM